MSKPAERYYLDTDSDGDQWFVVPVSKREQFDRWVGQDWQSPLSDFQVPEYVVEVEYPSNVTFEKPEDLT